MAYSACFLFLCQHSTPYFSCRLLPNCLHSDYPDRMAHPPSTPSSASISGPPPSLIPPDLWSDFMEWASDGGYDESYFNRWDSKSRTLEQTYLDERALEANANEELT